MCGIPMLPEADLARGGKVTFAQCLAHLGGVLVTEGAEKQIRALAKDYIWCYPGRVGYCTACGGRIEGIRGIHGERMRCPKCGREVTFRHERKGHQRIYDEFYFYEWRRSVLDPEAVALVAVYCGRNSTGPMPHLQPVQTDPSMVYLFRPGCAAVVYRKWISNFTGQSHWERNTRITPAHTGFGGPREYHVDYSCLREMRIQSRRSEDA